MRYPIALLASLFTSLSLCSYAQMRVVCGRDTLNGNIKEVTDFEYRAFDTFKSVHTYDDKDRETITYYSSRNGLLGERETIHGNDLRILESALFDNKYSLCEMDIYAYNEHGKEIEKKSRHRHCDDCNHLQDVLDGSISDWALGTSTSHVQSQSEYDDAGNLVKRDEQTYTDWFSNDSLIYTDTVMRVVTFRYANNGKVEEVKDEEISNEHFGQKGRTDTTLKVTYNKYDSIGNKVEEDELRKSKYESLKTWYYDGREITVRNLFEYDAHNNKVSSKAYFFDAGNRRPVKTYPGIEVGAGSRYLYDNLNNITSSTFYHLYRHEDGTESEEGTETTQHHAEVPDTKEYDSHGNIIEIMRGNVVMLKREIEYR